MKFLLLASNADSFLGFRAPLIAALQAKGLEVHVAAPGQSYVDNFRQRLQARGLHVHDFWMRDTATNPVADLRALFSMYRLMRKIRPEVVLGYTPKPVIYGSLAAWLARVPRRFVLITGLGYAFNPDQEGGFLQKLVQKLYAMALACSHKVIFQNPDDQALFRQRALLKPHTPSRVVNGSGVDVEDFMATALPQHGMRFLMVARLLGNKGVRIYVEAARRIRMRHPQVECALAGGLVTRNPDGISEQELDDWIASGALNYLGKLEDVRPALAASHVFVLPSFREGTPRASLEAMAMGRAIITADTPGCRETVIPEHNGMLVPAQCVDSLERAMQRFIDETALAQRMGQCSRAIAEDRYDVRKVNAVMLSEMGLA